MTIGTPQVEIVHKAPAAGTTRPYLTSVLALGSLPGRPRGAPNAGNSTIIVVPIVGDDFRYDLPPCSSGYLLNHARPRPQALDSAGQSRAPAGPDRTHGARNSGAIPSPESDTTSTTASRMRGHRRRTCSCSVNLIELTEIPCHLLLAGRVAEHKGADHHRCSGRCEAASRRRQLHNLYRR